MPQFSSRQSSPENSPGLANLGIVYLFDFCRGPLSRFSNHCTEPLFTLFAEDKTSMRRFVTKELSARNTVVSWSTLWKILTVPADARPKSRYVRSMQNPGGGLAAVLAMMCVLLVSGITPCAQAESRNSNPVQKEAVMTNHASGTFEVKLAPQKPDNKEAESANLGRMSIDKQFHGDLEATSKGEMLSAMSDVKGSAGYVAMERVSGTLHGRTGTFVLQHTGTMTRGAPQLSVTVVPDSGTNQLVGIAGTMTIKIVEGKHFYEFEYKLSEAP
jgi:uncharacterized protein DUF3224